MQDVLLDNLSSEAAALELIQVHPHSVCHAAGQRGGPGAERGGSLHIGAVDDAGKPRRDNGRQVQMAGPGERPGPWSGGETDAVCLRMFCF